MENDYQISEIKVFFAELRQKTTKPITRKNETNEKKESNENNENNNGHE